METFTHHVGYHWEPETQNTVATSGSHMPQVADVKPQLYVCSQESYVSTLNAFSCDCGAGGAVL